MSTRDDGGPAHPVVEMDQVTWQAVNQHMGMTLRDWFAGQFLSSYVSDNTPPPEVIACQCYGMADAMLAERAKR